MKKFASIFLVIILALIVFGCSEQAAQEVPIGEPGFKPSLAGIKLGDSQELVLQVLGDKYRVSIFDEAFSLGEPFIRMKYDNGITVIIGADTKKVLEIETESEDTTTNLGIRVGDKAEDALTKYRAYYQEPVSRHSDDTLIGWFLLEDEELIIFNFAKGEALVNDSEVKPGALVERIKLSNFKYMD